MVEMEIKVRCYDSWSDTISPSPTVSDSKEQIILFDNAHTCETKIIPSVEQIYIKHRAFRFREGKRRTEGRKTDLPKMAATIKYFWNEGKCTVPSVLDQMDLWCPLPRSQLWHCSHWPKPREPCSLVCSLKPAVSLWPWTMLEITESQAPSPSVPQDLFNLKFHKIPRRFVGALKFEEFCSR